MATPLPPLTLQSLIKSLSTTGELPLSKALPTAAALVKALGQKSVVDLQELETLASTKGKGKGLDEVEGLEKEGKRAVRLVWGGKGEGGVAGGGGGGRKGASKGKGKRKGKKRKAGESDNSSEISSSEDDGNKEATSKVRTAPILLSARSIQLSSAPSPALYFAASTWQSTKPSTKPKPSPTKRPRRTAASSTYSDMPSLSSLAAVNGSASSPPPEDMTVPKLDFGQGLDEEVCVSASFSVYRTCRERRWESRGWLIGVLTFGWVMWRSRA
jgi:hypothetical protein